MDLHKLQIAIEIKLEEIEKILGPNYKLTLIATHNGAHDLKDADILLTMVEKSEIMRAVYRFFPEQSSPGPRREFNKVGHPELPAKPTFNEIVIWLRSLGTWQEIQPDGRQMDAREWASTCLNAVADKLEQL